jgi:hypothetical protein
VPVWHRSSLIKVIARSTLSRADGMNGIVPSIRWFRNSPFFRCQTCNVGSPSESLSKGPAKSPAHCGMLQTPPSATSSKKTGLETSVRTGKHVAFVLMYRSTNTREKVRPLRYLRACLGNPCCRLMADSGGDKPRHYDHHPCGLRRGGVYPLPKYRRDDSSQTGSQCEWILVVTMRI